MTRSEIKSWLTDWISDVLACSPDDLEEDRTLGSYGLSNVQLESLACEVEDFFEEPLESGTIVKRATLGRVISEICILMDTDDEEFGELEPVRDREILQDIGLVGIA